MKVARLFAAASLAACAQESTGKVAGPPLLVAPSAPTTPAAAPPAPPVDARFVDVKGKTQSIPVGSCEELFVTPVRGTIVVAGETLAAGDVLATAGRAVEAHGNGLAVVASVAVPSCEPRHVVVRASAAPELTLAGGAMHAHLDLDDRAVAPTLYLGRLSGTAGVPEHAHDASWEVLCAVEAAGTFVLDGKENRLGPRTCVAVPAGSKHSWKPDPGSNLVAVQMYSPPGPEQRFKKLAADQASTVDASTK
jgi:mannose-6-phosphate isomerase-like protein (cupin superfamily)